MRNYERVDKWLDELLNDTHPQPPDEGHTKWARQAIEAGIPQLKTPCRSVIDMGCGSNGFVAPMFAEYGITDYAGVAIREDAVTALQTDLKMYDADFTFLDMIPDASYDIVFARHSLEHSPMPILTLFEWARITKKYIWLIMPDPKYWLWTGRNHYSVMHPEQPFFLLKRVGMEVIWSNATEYEFWYIAEKVEDEEDESLPSTSD